MPDTPTAHLTVAELLVRWPSAGRTLSRLGMACTGCAMAPFDTLAEVAAVYGIRAETLLAELQNLEDGAGGSRR
jgi:hybrid cluster-associated redox disulfide protein